ncbi:MAG: SPFH domain-containing protein [Anaerolineales bacterium]
MNLVIAVKALAAFSWLILIGVVVLVVVRAARDKKTKGAAAMIGGVLALVLVLNLLSVGLVFVEPNERAVVITPLTEGGIRPEALQPGLNWIVPFVENTKTYSISRQTYTMSIAHAEGAIQGDDSIEARTSDGQLVRVDASLIFAIDPNKVVSVHIDWQDTYVDGLIRTIARGVIRDAVSQYGIEEVYSSKRQDLTDEINRDMRERLEGEGFILVDFVLRNIAFSDEYAASVEQKQIAEQLAQQAAFVVEQRRQEAEQARQEAQGQADAAVIRAQGQAQSVVIQAEADAQARLLQAEAEAKALEMLGAALAENPDVIQLQYVEKIAPNITVMLLPGDNPFLLPLPDGEPGLTITP